MQKSILNIAKQSNSLLLSLLCSFALNSCFFQNNAELLVEAESFTDKGGWVIDNQFAAQMGSAYLMAHGMGTPVKDASTTVSFPEKGRYHIYVRTYNWMSSQKESNELSRFQLSIGDHVIDKTFGQDENDWIWSYGGEININEEKTTITLKDLDGLNARCDAIYFTKNKNSSPQREALEAPVSLQGQNFDLIVVGDSDVGLRQAVLSAQSGLNVALITSAGISTDESLHTNSKMLHIYQYSQVLDINMIDRDIQSLKIRETGTNDERTISAPLYIDCTSNLMLSNMSDARGLSEMEKNVDYTNYYLLYCSKENIGKKFLINGGRASENLEQVRDRALYDQLCSPMKTNKPSINWVDYILKKHEAAKPIGDHIVNKSDVENNVSYSDALVPIGYKNSFYHVPYRCFYSRHINNLFISGENISITKDAYQLLHFDENVEKSMVQVINLAALICKEHNIKPRNIYESHMNELKQLLSDNKL